MPEISGLNLHRGKLPEYKGVYPIKRALQNKEKYIYITSHILEKEIDSGEVIAIYKHPVNYNEKLSFDENVEKLKRELTPHFGPLLIKSMDILVNKYEKKKEKT